MGSNISICCNIGATGNGAKEPDNYVLSAPDVLDFSLLLRLLIAVQIPFTLEGHNVRIIAQPSGQPSGQFMDAMVSAIKKL